MIFVYLFLGFWSFHFAAMFFDFVFTSRVFKTNLSSVLKTQLLFALFSTFSVLNFIAAIKEIVQ